MTNRFDAILIVAWFLLFAVGMVRYERYIVHMFQENSYKPAEYGQWLRLHSNVGRLLGKSLYALIALPLLLIGNTGCLIAACLMNIMTILVNQTQPAKKPLVYTKRVKRMLVTSALLYAVAILAALFFSSHRLQACMCILLFLFLTQPFLILFVNLLNRPLERAIDRYYINDAARILREMPNLKIIGVTGSYGKTSVKYFLSTLLSVQYNVLHTPGNYNTTLGVVRTIREQLRPYHEIFVCEMGAREVGDIREICDLVHPDYGIITSIGPQHLQSFHTIDNIIATKFELADAVPAEGRVFLNYDNEYIRAHRTDRQVISYGIRGDDITFRAYDIAVSPAGSSFKMRDERGDEYEFHTRLVGSHNVQNIAGAIAVAHTLGIPMEKLRYPVKQLESVPHRLQLIRQGDRILLDDAYNSNKTGFKAALDTLAMFKELRILVTPGMVELGDKQYDENKEVGVYAADKCDYAVLVGKEQTRPIQDGLKEAGFAGGHMIVVNTIQEAFQMVNAIPDERQKIVLIENDLPDNYA